MFNYLLYFISKKKKKKKIMQLKRHFALKMHEIICLSRKPKMILGFTRKFK